VIEDLRREGLSVQSACDVAEMPKSSYYSHKKQEEKPEKKEKVPSPDDLFIIEKIKSIKNQHPFWGYRRVHAWLNHRDGIKINHKRVYRLMKENQLLVERKSHKISRKAIHPKPKAERPKEIWGIDMTKFIVEPVGWAYLVIVLDWFSRKIVGWDLSLRTRTEDWKRAMDMALNEEFPMGVRGSGLKLVSDNGCQPTSVAFTSEMSCLEIRQIFTAFSNPKGNAETERMMRTIKEEAVWINEFESFEEAKEVIGKWVEWYNGEYVHSSLGYVSPMEYEEEYYSKRRKEVMELRIAA